VVTRRYLKYEAPAMFYSNLLGVSSLALGLQNSIAVQRNDLLILRVSPGSSTARNSLPCRRRGKREKLFRPGAEDGADQRFRLDAGMSAVKIPRL
jgi:hypothetical protein